jgi:lysozyme
MSKTKSAATVAGAGAIAACVAFLPGWEGMDAVAKRDMIGTGHPVTYCYGQTDEFGAVKVGTRFTKAECDAKLAESLPKYLAKIDACLHVDMPDKTKAALLDAAYNAGPAAVCRSPMVAKMNAGDLEAGCNAFAGWYVRSDGVVRKGLVARRDGEDHGDHRKSEKGLCLEGLREVALVEPAPAIAPPVMIPEPAPPAPVVAAPIKRRHPPRAVAPPAPCPWWRRCT